jgi:hypothetical protein
MRTSLQALAQYSTPALEALLAERRGPSPDRLAGFLYRGLSLRLPSPAFALFGKFGKAFAADASGVRGWNARMRQGGDPDAWQPLVVRGKPVTYGHYRLRLADGDDPHPNALVIDYALGGNRRLDPLSRVVDYVVALGDDDLLLGRMYLRLGGRLVQTPSWFALQRHTPLEALVAPPRPR